MVDPPGRPVNTRVFPASAAVPSTAVVLKLTRTTGWVASVPSSLVMKSDPLVPVSVVIESMVGAAAAMLS